MTDCIPPLPTFDLPKWSELTTEPQSALCRFMWLYEPGVRGGAYNFRQALSAALAEQISIAGMLESEADMVAQKDAMIAELRRKVEFLRAVQADSERGHEAHLAEKNAEIKNLCRASGIDLKEWRKFCDHMVKPPGDDEAPDWFFAATR